MRTDPVRLAVSFAGERLQFSYATHGGFEPLGPTLDATVLSDEATTRGLGFTGTFVALGAHDVSGQRMVADFDYIAVQPAVRKGSDVHR